MAPKQIAYDLTAKFIQSSEAAYEKNKLDMPDDVRRSWEGFRDQVADWAGEAGIVSLEQQKKNREAGK